MKYPQATEDVKETKTVTRTIKYVDKANETTEVKLAQLRKQLN